MSSSTHAPVISGFPAALVQAALDDVLQQPQRPAVLAISGLQGSGKSTLAAQVVTLAEQQGLRAVQVSIDDFYLTRAQRQTLAQQVHPLLATRGPPGTHDTALALQCFTALRHGGPVQLPRFDKLADDRVPAAQWHTVDAPLDLVVFEGWFLGVPAQTAEQLRQPVNGLEAEQDPQGHWRSYCNDALASAYPALWQRWHRLWFLQPPDFSIIAHWRWQQEQGLQSAQPQRVGMNATQVARFVQYFERISRHALQTLPALADRRVMLDTDRTPLEVR